MQSIVPIFAVFLALSACVAPPEPMPAYDPAVDVTPGLNDKEPDLCRARNFTYYIGKPVAELHAAVADKPLLILSPGTLGSQDYDSARINAHVDQAGRVYRLSCG